MAQSLVPELRTDKNGKTSKRWVKPSSASSAEILIPAPAMKSYESNQHLMQAIFKALDNNPDRRDHMRDAEKLRVSDLVRSGSADDQELLEVFLNNASSFYPFDAYETLYKALRQGGLENCVDMIHEEALLDASVIVRAIPGTTPNEFTDEMNSMIAYALTSDERAAIVSAAPERHFATLEEMRSFAEELKTTEKALQSGVL